MIIVLLLWMMASALVGWCARSRGRSFWLWFMVSLILDPLFGAVLYNMVVRSK